MDIEFYNILKSGNYDKMRATKSTFNQRRRIVVYNPFAKELWQLNGYSLDSEIIRLTDYAMEKLKKYLKVRHRVKVIKPEDSQLKFNYLLNLAKNPELAEAEARASTKKPTRKTKKKTTKKPVKKTSKKTVKKISKKPTKKTVKKEGKKRPQRKLPRAAPSSVPQINLPTKSKKSTLGIAKGDLEEDGSAIKMVDEFQIAYYDASGEEKLLIEELEQSISEGEGYNVLITHIKLINELVKSKSSNTNAKKELEKSIKELTNVIFPILTTKKVTKKVTIKPKKKPAKKKATKKGKKIAKK